MIRKLLAKLLLMFVSLMVALVLAELALRLIPRGGVPVKDPYLGTVMTSGGEWDANGFRNRQILTQADIVAIGDSQTMGWNAAREEAWPMVLGSLASASVYEMALAGYGPVQYAYLADRALLLQPKLVIVGFYFGNDLYDAKAMAYESDAWKDLRDPNFKEAKGNAGDPGKEIDLISQAGTKPRLLSRWSFVIRDWFRTHSRLYVLTSDATKSLRHKLGVEQAMDERQENLQAFSNEHPEIAFVFDKSSPLSTVLSPRYRLSAVDLQNPETQEGWRITQGRYLAIKNACGKSRIPYLVLLIPTKEKVYLEFMKSRNEKIPDAFSVYRAKEDEAMATVEDFFRRNGIPYTSALPAMVDALTRGIKIYDVSIDGHPLAPGYRVIAEYVHHYLAEQNLLSSPRPVARP
jgi:lysophospholipase L1-like esterase